METLQDATVKICELKGKNLAQLALLACLVEFLPPAARAALPDAFERELELARTMLLNSFVSEHIADGLENAATSIRLLLASQR